LIVMLANCTAKRSDTAILPTELTGINGNAMYFFEHSEAIFVVKPEYTNRIDCDIMINRDTLMVGEEFVGYISVFKPEFTIQIETPKTEVISRRRDDARSEFRFVPQVDSIHTFSGTIQYDSSLVPFVYKFIVQR